jgi:general secretion pathway protein M
MITPSALDRYVTRYPAIPVLIYIALVLSLLLTSFLLLIDTVDRYRAVERASEVLARLERRAPVAQIEPSWDSAPPGSPFLAGETVTVASAALLERLTAAVARAGGTVASFAVEPQSADSKDGYVKVIANCEIDPEALQGLLYDLEAGMPFLFVEQLAAQAPQPNHIGGRMHLLVGASGMWLEAK